MKRIATLLFLIVTTLSLTAYERLGCATDSAVNTGGQSITLPTHLRGATLAVLRPDLQRDANGNLILGSDGLPIPRDYPDGLESAFTDAATRWSNHCPSDTNLYFPRLRWAPERTNQTDRFQVTVVFHDTQAPPGNQVASYNYTTNILHVYGLCGNTGLPCVNGNLDYTSQILLDAVAHEVGHALGLGHDFPYGECINANGIMREHAGGSRFLDEYCSLANKRNCDPANPASTCPGGPYSVKVRVADGGLLHGQGQQVTVTASLPDGSSHTQSFFLTPGASVDTGAIFPTGTKVKAETVADASLAQICTVSPAGEVTIQNFHAEFSLSCDCSLPSSPDGPCYEPPEWDPYWELEKSRGGYWPSWWWGVSFFSCDTLCFPGRPDCRFDLDGDGKPDCVDYTLNCYDSCSPLSLSFSAPLMAVYTPWSGQVVRGTLNISGWAVDEQGIQKLGFFIDNKEVEIGDLRTTYRPEACAFPLSPPAAQCNKNGGFEGRLDISSLAPGQHTLTVVAVDGSGPQYEYPVPQRIDLTFQVADACSDTAPPTVSITSPRNNDIVLAGLVPVSLNAADDSGVVRVEFYADDALFATSFAAPFATWWDATGVAPGSRHRLRAKAFDACGNIAESSTVEVEVRASLPRPNARNDKASTKRGVPVSINVLANDRHPSQLAIRLTAAAVIDQPDHGTTRRVSDTTIEYTPNAGYVGNDAFTYEIVDTAGVTDRAKVAVAIRRGDGTPVAVEDNVATEAGKAVSIEVTANDYHTDGGAVLLIASPFAVQPQHGTVARVSQSTVTYTPAPNYTGSDSFEYIVGDGEGHRARGLVRVTITNPNRAPVANPDSASTATGQAVTIDVTANDTDPDGDQVLLITNPIYAPPANGTATRVSQTSIAYQPKDGWAGTDTFTYEIGDGRGRRARALVTVTVANTNHPPEAVDDEVSMAPGTAVTVEVTANDSDADGNRITLITSPIVAAPANGTAVKISGTAITYTPRSGFTGTDRFQYEIGDGHGARARAWVNVTVVASPTVNRNPIAVDDVARTKSGVAIDVNLTANDSDPDGDAVTLIASPIIVTPQHGTVTKLSGSSIRYTPAANYAGVDTFQYEIGDGRGKRARGWASIRVDAPNSRPVAVDDTVATPPDTAISIEVTANDSDPDGDAVRLLTSPIVVPPANGTVTKLSADAIRYTPRAGYLGADRFQYEIGDGNGARSRAWVNVTVAHPMAAKGYSTAPNVEPVAQNDLAEVAQDAATSLAVVANDFDADGDTLVLTESPIVTAPLYGTAVRTDDSTIAYAPLQGFTGNDGFEYEVADGRGGTARAWVVVQIPTTNRMPRAVADTVTAAMNASATFTAVANDTDADGDELTLSQRAVVVQPRFGTVRRESDRELTYTPAPGFFGDDAFVYEISDGRGGIALGNVAVSVINSTRPPMAGNDNATVESGLSVTVNALANDSDPDGDVIAVVGSSAPQHGSVVWSEEGTATYTSTLGYTGADTFTYTISDAKGVTARGTIAITVTAPRRAPVVQNDTASTKTRTAVLVGVLANDYDPDWQKLTISSVTRPGRGTAVINRGESVTYTPASDFAGSESFAYTVTDVSGLTATATVTVTVLNNPPTARSDSLAAPEDTWVSYWPSTHLAGNDTDPDGDELRVTAIEQPQHGQLLIAADLGSISYRSKENWSGIDLFYYTVSDPFGAKVRVPAQINVTAVNDSPNCANDAVSAWKNETITITSAQLFANDTDVEGHQLTLYSVTQPVNGQAQLLADGTIRYTPYGEFVGNDTFEYTVQDSGGAYASALVTVTVRADSAPVAAFTVTCVNRACAFDASASTDDRGIVTYSWKIGPLLTAAGKSFHYTYDKSGTYQIELTVTDALNQKSKSIKFITVTEPAPNAVDDFYWNYKGYARSIPYSFLLQNDTDPANDALTVTGTDTSVLSGTLECDAQGCTFTPPSKYWYGRTTFTYTISDGHGGSDTATVTIEFR